MHLESIRQVSFFGLGMLDHHGVPQLVMRATQIAITVTFNEDLAQLQIGVELIGVRTTRADLIDAA